MKIALVNSTNPKTGMGKYAFKIFEKMRESKKDVSMFYTNYNYQKFSHPRISSIQAMKLPFLRQTLNDIFYFPKKIPKDYDIYHLTNQGTATYLKKIKAPKIITVHDMIPFSMPENLPITLNKTAQFVIRHAKHADYILTDSEFSKNEIIKYLKIPEDKIKVSYLGIDFNVHKPRDKIRCRKELNLPLNKKIILHVGNDEPRKNISTILKAMHILKDENLLFVRVGSFSDENKSLIKNLNVKVLKNLSENHLAMAYSAADVFVFPSSYEGFGVPVLEAMACGCPVLSSTETSLKEIVADAGLHIQPKDSIGLAKHLKYVLENEDIRKVLIKKGLKHVSKFTWENTAKQVLEVYKKGYK